MVCPAPVAGGQAGGHRGVENQLLAALALENEASRTPPVDLTERHLLNFVMPFEALDDFRFLGPMALLKALDHAHHSVKLLSPLEVPDQPVVCSRCLYVSLLLLRWL